MTMNEIVKKVKNIWLSNFNNGIVNQFSIDGKSLFDQQNEFKNFNEFAKTLIDVVCPYGGEYDTDGEITFYL